MRVGERLAELLVENGVEYVFGVPGGQTLPLYEGISKYQGRIEHVLMRDERSAGYAADAFARVTGKLGVCDGGRSRCDQPRVAIGRSTLLIDSRHSRRF